LYDQYKSKVNFITVYIAEAHASDEWPVRTTKELQCRQHRNNFERWNAANKFAKEFNYKIPCIIDSVKNEFQTTYAAWPARAYLIVNKKIQFILNPINPGYFDFGHLEFAIRSHLATM
jgi:type I thyroxine 5'-deiodinase